MKKTNTERNCLTFPQIEYCTIVCNQDKTATNAVYQLCKALKYALQFNATEYNFFENNLIEYLAIVIEPLSNMHGYRTQPMLVNGVACPVLDFKEELRDAFALGSDVFLKTFIEIQPFHKGNIRIAAILRKVFDRDEIPVEISKSIFDRLNEETLTFV